jgi:hypothetical protein
MDFVGRYEIPASPEAVWAALNDPSILQSCIPGCERLTRRDGNRFDAVAELRVGPVTATFQSVVEQSEMDPPCRFILKGEGRGGEEGFGRGDAEILLVPEDGGTVVSFTARAIVGGKLAQIGQRLVDRAARQFADDFFSRLVVEVSRGLAVPAAPASPESAIQAMAEPGEIPREGLAPEIWVIGLIAVIVILLVLFGVAL